MEEAGWVGAPSFALSSPFLFIVNLRLQPGNQILQLTDVQKGKQVKCRLSTAPALARARGGPKLVQNLWGPAALNIPGVQCGLGIGGLHQKQQPVHPFLASNCPPPPASPCIAQASVKSPCQAAGAMDGRSGLTCMRRAWMRAVLPPCITRRCLQSSCLCVCGCSKPVDAVWGLRGPYT